MSATPLTATRVLIVDDDPRIRAIFAAALRAEGVLVAASADEAADILDRCETLRLILCDLDLGSVSGRSVFSYVQDHRPELAQRFVLMSGYLQPEDRAFLDEHGLESFEKPGSLAALRRLAQRYLQEA